MKKLFPLVLLAFFAVFISCESETLETPESQQVDMVYELSSDSQNRTASDLLQHRLQWTSFLCARVLLDHPELRGDLETHIDANGNVVLEELLEEGIGWTNPFRDKFIYYLSLYINIGDGHPDTQEDSPGFPVIPTGGNQFVSLTLEEKIDIFMDYVLNENCVEIYVPNALFSAGDTDKIISTAHPLTTSQFSVGLMRITCIGTEFCATRISFPRNLETDNILIARPVRDLSDSNCDYSEYSRINFRNFYNQH
ncbi:hypothetical protein POV27_18470 [Aureisphaera galaxeae]|uniref:hypothetical protein n=1 Tax=Aureisphaera galaxeae TaxID=1538023 RepID=UPI00235101AB|nr:hypothetical protein [Aureisphaera galaxeae]MDC8006043.1 hypothetical protein [Aureisphaera galaxeae]